MRVACVVPCRAGSRRVPGKNLKPLNGRPLLSYVLDAAAAARCFDESTAAGGRGTIIEGCGVFVVSDDPAALDLACSSKHNAGAIEIPATMAGADSPVVPVLRHAADIIGADQGADLDAICYLRATSPFVRPQTVRRAIRELAESRSRPDAPGDCFDSILGVVPVTGAHPSRFKRIDSSTGLLLDAFPEFPEGRVPQRSETLRAFQRNSAVTACWIETTLRGGSLWGDRAKALVMDEIESVDINTPLEFEFAEFLSARPEPLT